MVRVEWGCAGVGSWAGSVGGWRGGGGWWGTWERSAGERSTQQGAELRWHDYGTCVLAQMALQPPAGSSPWVWLVPVAGYYRTIRTVERRQVAMNCHADEAVAPSDLAQGDRTHPKAGCACATTVQCRPAF